MSHNAIGVAYEDQNLIGSQTVAVDNSTGQLGYRIGYNGTVPSVTQATSKSTGVTLNNNIGKITMNNAALANATAVKFTVTNSNVTVGDVPSVAIVSGGTSGDYLVSVGAVATGSFDVVLYNVSGGSLSEAVVIGFANIQAIAL